MSQGTLPRARRELSDVRHPLHPGLRIDRVLVVPSGIHVLTTVPTLPGGAGADVDPGLVAGARAGAEVVASLLPQRYHPRIRPVLVLVGAEPLAEHVDEVLVTTPATLEHILRSSLVVLSTSEVHDVGLRLEARFEPFPVAVPPQRTRSSRRRTLLATAGAAACAGAVVLLEWAGALPVPW